MMSKHQQFLFKCIGYLVCASPVFAQGGWANADPAGTGNNNNNGQGYGYTGSGSTAASGGRGGGGGGTSSDFGNLYGGGGTNKTVTIHAVLACLVWVLYVMLACTIRLQLLISDSLIPLGGILIRSGLNIPGLVKIHAFLQSISYIIYIVAAGMGIYLVNELSVSQYSLWSDPHTKIGIGILGLAFFMPILGLIHHTLYKRRARRYKEGGPRPGRTIPGYLHLWLGRILIPMGMVNGGLGIRLASNAPGGGGDEKKKIIGYSIGAGLMFLAYVIFVIVGEVRRKRERQGRISNRRAGPMVPQAYQPVRGVDNEQNVPPSYEQSQTFLPNNEPKDADGTARYQ